MDTQTCDPEDQEGHLTNLEIARLWAHKELSPERKEHCKGCSKCREIVEEIPSQIA